MTPFIGFMPDVDPTTPGAILDMTNIIPTAKGLAAAPRPEGRGIDALPEAANSLVVVPNLDGSRQTYAGGFLGIYEKTTATAWTDRSRLVGGDYNVIQDHRWSFAQFGNVTLAANISDVMQSATTAEFADITGAPQAKYIAVSDGFVMAVNTSTSSDQWHCSAYNDYTDWTEAVSTQCTSGRLINNAGELTGVKKLGTGFVAFKRRSIYVASYVGAPIVWQWTEIPGDIGCLSNDAAVDIGDRIAFLGNDDFYIFDGASPIPIGEGIREWFFGYAKKEELYRTIATYDDNLGNITWHYVSVDNTTSNPDAALVYNLKSRKWGKYRLTIEAAAKYYISDVTYDGFGALVDSITGITDSTYDDIPTDFTYNFANQTDLSAVILTDHIMYPLSGAPVNSSITMNYFGDDETFSTISRVIPRFLISPETSSVLYSYDNTYGDGFTEKIDTNLIDGRYDLLWSSRWHKLQFKFTGAMEINGVKVILKYDGTE